MFFDKFKQLCDDRGISPSKAAIAMGMSNSTPTKWKKNGITPDGRTLEKVCDFFGVSVDYFVGPEDAAQLAYWGYQVKKLTEQMETETSPDKRFSLAAMVDVALGKYNDLATIQSLKNTKKNKPTDQVDGLDYLYGTERVLLHGFRDMDEADQQFMIDYITLKRKGKKNDVD